MAKKTFDTQSTTDKFFTQGAHDTQGTQDKQDTQKKQGRPKKETPLRGYRYNLTLDADLKQYLHEIVWQKRTSMTQYVNDLIRADMERYFAEGGTKDGWEEDE